MMSAVRRSLITSVAGYGICTFLACTGNVPQSFSTPAPSEVGKTATAAVSSSGGTLKSANGTANVSVPPGALAGSANLTVTVKDKTLAPNANALLSNVYDLGPTGTQFFQPVTLSFQASGTPPQGQKAVLAFLNAQQAWQIVPNSTFDPNTMTVVAQVNHFTDFAVTYVSVAGTGCANSPDPNAYCSPLACDTVNDVCQTPAPVVTSFLVGGSLQGLTGDSVVLANNGGDLLTLSQNGNFDFATAQNNGDAYLVTVAQSPNGQACSVSNNSGVIAGADINSVQVLCSPAYNVGGTVAGLGSAPVVLQNGNTQVSVTAGNPDFVVANLPTGTPYAVTVQIQPTGQDCEVTGGTGNVGIGDVNTIVVQCSNLSYPLGGTVTGLVASANVTLQDATDTISVSNGVYTFPTAISFNESYSVNITSPTGQSCTFAPNVVGQGSMTAAPVTSVDVICTPLAYPLGGSITGLMAGTNVVLSNGVDSISVANGDYTLPTAVPFTSDYNIIVTAPAGQVCVATTPDTLSGTMPAAAVQQVGIVCSLGSYPVGGTITGLVQNTNVTLSNGADTIYVGPGTYAFPTPVTYTRPYAVSIIMSPPFQSCTFTNAGTSAGTMPPGGVSNVDITCTAQGFTLGGGVSGLAASTQVTLGNGNDSITTGNGDFSFPTQVPYGSVYAIDVTSPSGQTCSFAPAESGNGIMPAANLRTLSLVCAPTQYPLGGTISGLVSNTNVTLTNGADSISVTNGDYAFPTTLVAGANYAVSLTAPTAQTCKFSPSGVNAGSMVSGGFSGVNITCVPSNFMVGGVVSGLVSNTSLGIADGVDTINANNGAYTLPTPVAYGSTLTVTANSPVGQTCLFGNGNATQTIVMGHTDVTNINISCALLTYPVGGFITGLVNNANVTLQNGNDSLQAANGAYAFPTSVAYNSPYNVTLTSPAGQTCSFTGAHSGTMGAAAISNIGVSCVSSSYALGGSVAGLIAGATVTVRQGGDTLTVGNSDYTLPTHVAFGATYSITVTQPTGQSCVFGDGNTFSTAIMGAADMTNANITCSPSAYTVGGNVSGLVASNEVTLLNGNDSITVSNGRYMYPTPVSYGATYSASVLSPNGQACTFTGTSSGTMGASNVTTADVLCTSLPFALGGQVSGLVNGTTVMVRNGGDSISVGNGNFAFPTQVVYNTFYSASLVLPAGQTCVFSPASASIGMMPANAVSSINVTCGAQTYTLGGTLSGLVANTNATLQNGNDTIVVSNGAFVFDIGLPYSTGYNVIVASPAGQTCNFVGSSAGTMGATNVTNLNLVCTPQTYWLGGTVSGLVGSGMVTLQNGSDNLPVGNGSFSFPTQVAYGSPYSAALVSPSGQSCTFSPANSNAGTMPAAAVGNIDVVCGPQTYTLGGAVSGLSPNTQVTLQNGADGITVGNGSYSFPTALAFSSGYNATIAAPSGQVCVFAGSGHAGTTGAANITNLNVICSARTYTLGGVVSGLVGSGTLTLQQGGDSIAVGNGNYTFPTAVAFGAAYSASLVAPAGQSCAFSPPSSSAGAMPANNVTSINVTCGAQTYTLGGSISGLTANSNIALQNGNDALSVPNGLYTFSTPLPFGTAYAVSLTSPAGQTCAFVGAHSGTMGAANITNIGVNCAALNYSLGGSVTGLVGSGTVTLQNGGDSISVSNGSYTFPTQVSYNSNYSATLISPSGQTCVFVPYGTGSGAMPANDLNSINVSCGPQTYTLGGNISGLVSNTQVTLQNGDDNIAFGNGAFTFPTGLAFNTDYNATILSPTGQTCAFGSGHSGTMGATNVATLRITCSTQSFVLGGMVSGLVGNNVVGLQNGADSMTLSNGAYAFATPIPYASSFSVSALSPPGEDCEFDPPGSNLGTMPGNDYNALNIICAPQAYSVGGTVVGLVANANVALQNGNDTLSVGNGSFVFPTSVTYGATYAAALISPVGQVCTFSGSPNGTVGAANVTNLAVACTASTYVLGGTVSGLAGTTQVTLTNGSDSVQAGNGNYTFPTVVTYGANYSAQLTSPAGQTCSFSPTDGNAGTMPANDAAVVDVVCGSQTYTLGGEVVGLLSNTNLTLQNGVDTVSIGNGSYTFPTALLYSAAYSVSVTAPAGQSCTFDGDQAGTVGAGNITDINLTCVSMTYALGGSVSGLVGGAQLNVQNGNDTLTVGNGNFTFPTSVVYNGNYSVTLTAPSGQTCAFSPDDSNVGVMLASAVTSVSVSCDAQAFVLSGTVSGLLGNNNVTLQNGSDTLNVSNGAYAFPTAIPYNDTFAAMATSPDGQVCTFVGAASGTMGTSDITHLDVDCAAQAYTVGGRVTGLVGGSNVTLQNGNDTISATNGNYTFPTPVAYGSTYAVTLTAPDAQVCTFSSGDDNSATMGSEAVVGVNIACVPAAYALGGSVAGLQGNTTLTLQSGGDTIVVPNGSYTFPTPVAYNSSYAITLTAPAGQTCAFDPVGVDSGTMPTSAVSNANIICLVNGFSVGGTVSGLAQGANLVLGNANDTLTVTDDLSFTFATPVVDQGDYNVFIVTQPTSQVCMVSDGRGSIAGGNVTNVTVSCASGSYALSVSISGLKSGGSVGVTNGADTITVSGNDSGTFPTSLSVGDAYSVTVSSQPMGQTCMVVDGVASMPSADTAVAITCSTYLTFATSQSAVTVIGQPDFTSNNANVDAVTLSNPLGAVFAAPNGDLYLSDTENLRVVGYHQGIPATPGTPFDFEIGQPDFVTSQSWVAPNANSYYPHTIVGNANVMVVTDGYDSRVLILHTFPETTVAADVVLGQPDFISNGSDCTQTSLNGPRGAMVTAGNKLFVADTLNNRVLLWNSMPTSNGQGADVVLGQPDFTTCNAPGNNASAANTLSQPWDVWSDGVHVLVADTYANRVLVWNTFPTSIGQNADAVIGQPDWSTNVAGPIATSLATPAGVTSDGNSIFIAEFENMRVGQWSGLPWQQATPTLGAVLGQPDVNTATCNPGAGTPSDNTMCQLGGVSIVGTQLVVADTANNRFLVFQSQ